MKKIGIIVCLFLLVIGVSAQKNGASQITYSSDIQKIATIKSKGRILVIKPEYQIPANTFLTTYTKELGLSSSDEFVLKEETAEHNGVKTYRYVQQFHGVPIEGATLVLHEKNGVVTYVNGLFVRNFSQPFTPTVNGTTAVETAIAKMGAAKYAWENESLEQDLKMIRNDEKATYYPTPRLIFFDQNHSSVSENYRLAYEVSVFAIDPFETRIFYIDAYTGEILKSVKKNQNANVEVQAVTRYNGTQTITVDSVAPNQFVLREFSRGEGNGIYTRSLNHAGSLFEIPVDQAVDVVETDNFFDGDRVANAAHYGAEKTYDFYYQKFNRNSIDNQGLQLLSYVHWGSNIENAAWSEGAMYYGDGTNGNEFTFLTVCGHEISHGLTENTANLIYEYESGALNEAFSDMFGVAISYFGSDTLKWTIGDELGTPFRDMSNPNAYQNPDTYMGTYWVSDESDNGGVHTNSGPANYWFYLISVGGSGVNDHGTAYEVSPIGIDKADSIAFYTLTENLVETSDYEEACELSLLVAADLYGECSPEVYAVAAAWRAVGVGYGFSDTNVYVLDVLSPATDCALGSEETVTLELMHNSCENPLAAGTPLNVRLVLDGNVTISDTVLLSEDLTPGLPFEITLPSTIDVSATGEHSLSVYVKPSFAEAYTDSLIGYVFSNLVYQNSDIHVVDILSPKSGCFLDEQPVTVRYAFDICDSIAAGDSIRVGFKLNSGDTIVEYIHLDQTVTFEDTLSYTFETLADMTGIASNTLRVFALNPGDLDASDNVRSATIKNPTPLNELECMTFDESGMASYYFTEVGEYSQLNVGTLSGYNGGKLAKISGGNILEYYSNLEFPSSMDDWWTTNPQMNSKMTFCADATDYAELSVLFDLKQTSGKTVYEQMLGSSIPAGLDLLMSSMMRVLVDGEQVGENYTPTTPSDDPFTRRSLNLTSFAGGKHSLSFEAKCIAGDLIIYTLDHVYLDNISLVESSGVAAYSQVSPNISVYPNPASSNFSILMENVSNLASMPNYQLFDTMGRMVTNGLLDEDRTIVNVNGLAKGIYILKVIDNNRVVGTTKIVKE